MKRFTIYLLFCIIIANNSDCKQIETGGRKLPKVPRICQTLPQFTKRCHQKRNKSCRKLPGIVKSCQNALKSFQNLANACLNKVSKVEIAQETEQKRFKRLEKIKDNKMKKLAKALDREKDKCYAINGKISEKENEKKNLEKMCLVKDNILQQSLNTCKKIQHIKNGKSTIIFHSHII